MLALGPEYLVKLFELMDDEETRDLSTNMANLGGVESSTVVRSVC